MIAYILGNIIRIEAALLAVPAFVSIWYQEAKAASAFVATIIACLMVGTVLVSREPENKRIYGREGFVVVALSWIVMSVLGALPFYLSGSISGYVNCFFETVSGFTTTGASILQEIETLPKSIQFWRCFTHWIGGMGILVFMLAPWGRAHDVSDEGGGTRTSGFQAGAKGKIDSKNPVYDLYCTDTGGDDFAVCRWNAFF